MRFFVTNVLLLLVIINVTFACECGIEGATSRVFKGTIARANKYPWLVHLRFWPSAKRSGKFSQCGGVLIDESHVATAAHCVLDDNGNLKDLSKIDVYLGRVLALSGHSKPVSVSKIWFDSKFDHVNLSHDFAILTLSSSVTFTKTVGPICLPNNENDLSQLTITGWGKTSNKSATSDMLMEAQVDYINRKDCYEMKKYYAARINGYPKFFKDMIRVEKIPETLFCAINKRTHADICQGDSGGPIMAKGTNEKYYLMGTVSGLMGYCGEEAEDVTGIYTRTLYYKDTIKSIAPNACWKD